jgi:hypothetical protein
MNRRLLNGILSGMGVLIGIGLHACDLCVDPDKVSVEVGTYAVVDPELEDATLVLADGEIRIEYTSADGLRWCVRYVVVGWVDDPSRDVTYE